MANYGWARQAVGYDVQSIIEDHKGIMWFATKNGLTSFNPTTGQTQQHFDETNLLRNYYADDCASILPDGRIAFGTNAGILIYDPEKAMAADKENNRLSVTGILVNGVQREINGTLVLAYDDNSVTIRFSTFNYHFIY